MKSKTLIKEFKNFVNGQSGDLMAMVAEVDPITLPEMTKLLDVVLSEKVVDQEERQRYLCAVFIKLVERSEDKGLFKPLVKGLRYAEGFAQDMIVHLLPKVNNIREHADLCNVMRHNDRDVREAAARSLAKVGGKAAFQSLHEMLGESHFHGRIETMDALASMAGHHAIATMEAVFSVGTPEEKIHALKILSNEHFVASDREGALEVISIAFEDRNATVLAEAARDFGSLCSEEQYYKVITPLLEINHYDVVVAALHGLGRFQSRRALNLLERKLREGPNKVRSAVLHVLEEIGNESILPVLMVGMSFRHVAVRKEAADVLVNLAQGRKIDVAQAVIWLLRSNDKDLRRMAADLVNRVKDPENNLWPKLISFLRDEDWWVRERVMDALIKMAGTQLTKYIVAHLKDGSAVVRRFFVEVLRRLKDPKALGTLVQLARDDSDWWVRERAVEAMAATEDKRAIPYIIDLMSREPDLQIVSIVALVDMKAKESLPRVAELLNSEDEDVRMEAVECIGALGDRSMGSALRRYTNDNDARFRERINEILKLWGYGIEAGGEEGNQSLSFLDRLLLSVVKAEGDDLLLTPDRRPSLKRMGTVQPVINTNLSDQQIRGLIMPLLKESQVDQLENLDEIDFSYLLESTQMRFRANDFMQR